MATVPLLANKIVEKKASTESSTKQEQKIVLDALMEGKAQSYQGRQPTEVTRSEQNYIVRTLGPFTVGDKVYNNVQIATSKTPGQEAIITVPKGTPLAEGTISLMPETLFTESMPRPYADQILGLLRRKLGLQQ